MSVKQTLSLSRFQTLTPALRDDNSDAGTLPPVARTGGPWLTGDLVWLLVAIGVGLLLRLIHIGHQPFWLDEALTFQRIHLDPPDLVNDSFANRHMPSYFLLLQLLVPYGPGAALLRIPSALLGALSVGMVFTIAHRVGGRNAGVMAGLRWRAARRSPGRWRASGAAHGHQCGQW